MERWSRDAGSIILGLMIVLVVYVVVKGIIFAACWLWQRVWESRKPIPTIGPPPADANSK